MWRSSIVVLLSLAATGCPQPAVGFVSPMRPFTPSARSPGEIEIYFEGQARPHRIKYVAIVTGKPRNEPLIPTIEAMKRAAALRGLDGIDQLVCASYALRGGGSCEGKGFVYVP